MHGATSSSGSLFDMRLGGLSFLDRLVLSGLDVFALDVRGDGGSTRPPDRDAAQERGAPIVRTGSRVRTGASCFGAGCG